ncbi:MAG: prepilin-type N-terminal cleavage/methylation domain-containing protein [Lentisphaeria bacterium]|nr:prepilin-type N-terminal cleavage/methylation domain-containing protein [Lentisphaeria bacterium]
MRKFFTLIELLTVIGVISILAAMLLPALMKARGKAVEISCMSNLKQLGMGSILYNNDYKDYFHASKWGKAEGISVNDNFYFYCFNPVCNTEGRLLTPDEITEKGEEYWKIWQCPDFDGEEAWEYTWMGWNSTRSNDVAPKRRPKTGYQYNGCVGYNNQVISEYGSLGVKSGWTRITKAPTPSQLMLMMDRCNCAGNGGSWIVWYMINREGSCDIQEVEAQYCRHNGFCNISFADGHVGTATWNDLCDLANSGDGDTAKFAMQLGGDGQD